MDIWVLAVMMAMLIGAWAFSAWQKWLTKKAIQEQIRRREEFFETLKRVNEEVKAKVEARAREAAKQPSARATSSASSTTRRSDASWVSHHSGSNHDTSWTSYDSGSSSSSCDSGSSYSSSSCD